jgi:hypothetical protein
MNRMKKSLLLAAPVAALGLAALTMPGAASAADTTSYQATLNSLNNSSASGSLMLSLNGSQATITEHVTGLAATFGGKPYPHVQHIHIGADGVCPTTAADTNKDGVISTTEGGPSYGAIGTTDRPSTTAGRSRWTARRWRRCSRARPSWSCTVWTRPRSARRLRVRRATWCRRCRWPRPHRQPAEPWCHRR